MRVLILTNGDYGDYWFCRQIEAYDVIICADNGMKHARHLGILPNLIVGDFDSSVQEDLEYFKERQVPVQAFSSVKDETDTEIALDTAIKMGADSVDIFGGAGTRLDHTLANVHLLYKALMQGVSAKLINAYNTVCLIDKKIELYGNKGDIISLLPFSSSVSGINTENLGYPIKNGSFVMGKPYGVSNYMLSDTASVTIQEGLLLVIKARD